jgi:hypothetical protein
MSSPLLSSLSFETLTSRAYVFVSSKTTILISYVSLLRTKVKKSKSEWNFSLYQRYDQGPPTRGCENPEDKWVMSPLRYLLESVIGLLYEVLSAFHTVVRMGMWRERESVEGYKILKRMVEMRFGVARP